MIENIKGIFFLD